VSMSLAAPMFTNHPICDSIRTSAAANCVSSNEKAIFENLESDQSVARLVNPNFGLKNAPTSPPPTGKAPSKPRDR
jgi:hypothetical protein